MFYSRSLIDLAFISTVCDLSQVNFCAGYKVGVKEGFFCLSFIAISNWSSTTYWEDHQFSVDIQWHPHHILSRHHFGGDMLLESLSHSIGLCANIYTSLITIALEQVLLFGSGCTTAVLFVFDIALAIWDPSVIF